MLQCLAGQLRSHILTVEAEFVSLRVNEHPVWKDWLGGSVVTGS